MRAGWVLLLVLFLTACSVGAIATNTPSATPTPTTTAGSLAILTITCADHEPIEYVSVKPLQDLRESAATVSDSDTGDKSTGKYSFRFPSASDQYNVTVSCGNVGGNVKFNSTTARPVVGSVTLHCAPPTNGDPKTSGICK